jgi:hypothetical protein
MNYGALSPAEMARSGTMSEAMRRQNMGMSHGGTIIDGYDYGKKKKKKRSKNTKRMNELEEMGRIDTYKGKSHIGKKNLKAEKKRIIRQLRKGKA